MQAELAMARLNWVAGNCIARSKTLFAGHQPDAPQRLDEDGQRLLADLHAAEIERETDWMLFLDGLALKGVRPGIADLKQLADLPDDRAKVQSLKEFMGL